MNMPLRLILLAAALGAAGASAQANQGGRGGAAPYRGLGTEPFWDVQIGRDFMTFEGLERPRVRVRTPAVQRSHGVRRYVTRRLRVEITPDACSDGMSNRTYADTISVMVDGTQLGGCGGRILREDVLEGTNWRIAEIDGSPIAESQGYSIAFTADRVSGQAGCNRFNGSYRWPGGTTVEFAPLATTRMACPPPRMAHEQAVLRILSGEVRMEENELTSIRLSGNGGTILLEVVR